MEAIEAEQNAASNKISKLLRGFTTRMRGAREQRIRAHQLAMQEVSDAQRHAQEMETTLGRDSVQYAQAQERLARAEAAERELAAERERDTNIIRNRVIQNVAGS